jgi:hypothetical protein
MLTKIWILIWIKDKKLYVKKIKIKYKWTLLKNKKSSIIYQNNYKVKEVLFIKKKMFYFKVRVYLAQDHI